MSPRSPRNWEQELGRRNFKQSLREFLTSKTEFKVDDASVILVSRENRSIVGKKEITQCYDCPRGQIPMISLLHLDIRECTGKLNLSGCSPTSTELFTRFPFGSWVRHPSTPRCARSVPIINKSQIFTTWNGLLGLSWAEVWLFHW